jgi:hypothetical protein
MTKISYIHGLKPNEIKDRAKNVTPQNMIDFSAMTEGELRLALLAEQVSMLSQFYPERQDLQQSLDLLNNTLYKGVHATAGVGSFSQLSASQQVVAQAIRNARKQFRPANGRRVYGRTTQGIGKKGIDPPISQAPLVPLLDCDEFTVEQMGIEYDELDNPTTILETVPIQPQYSECINENINRKILNEHLEKSAHHLLYEFVAAQELNQVPQNVNFKANMHKLGRNKLSEITGISNDLIRLWLRNGVIRYNIFSGNEPMQPEESIDILKQGAFENTNLDDHIGSFVLTILIPLLKALAAAIAAIVALVQATKQKENMPVSVWDQVQGIGTPDFSADNQDWWTPGGQPPGGQQQQQGAGNLQGLFSDPVVLLGAGGLALLALSE